MIYQNQKKNLAAGVPGVHCDGYPERTGDGVVGIEHQGVIKIIQNGIGFGYV